VVIKDEVHSCTAKNMERPKRPSSRWATTGRYKSSNFHTVDSLRLVHPPGEHSPTLRKDVQSADVTRSTQLHIMKKPTVYMMKIWMENATETCQAIMKVFAKVQDEKLMVKGGTPPSGRFPVFHYPVDMGWPFKG